MPTPLPPKRPTGAVSRIRAVVVIVASIMAFAVIFTSRLETNPDQVEDGRSTVGNGTTDSSVLNAPDQDQAIESPQRVGFVTSRDGALLRTSPTGSGEAIRSGVVFAVLAERESGFDVFDACNREGWLAANDVQSGLVPITRDAGSFEHAVFVIDPGHGLPDLGAVGPQGLTESEVALDVSARIANLVSSSHTVDWATGEVLAGEDVPPAAEVVLTRSPEGPNSGEYDVGLTFRAELANSVDATALVSVHVNSAPVVELDHPGSEAYVSVSNPESPRLGGLIVEELRKEFSRFEADWVGAPGDGVFSRVDADGTDYYTILERSRIPAALVEGAYISNPSEEALAMTDEFRQAYASGVYRALVRFVTTADNPIPAPDPELWTSDRPARSMDDCQIL